ncbi:uncharacterized protein, partial [Panulirus ornatus]|uniref:uncharacterized protein n=1 Tax=Panulirus ornatus TaxID=150431 RepID=UPI003A8810D9
MAHSMPKRQRTSTYEILKETGNPNLSNDVLPVGESQQKIEDNNKQLNLLVQKVSNKRRTRTIAVHSPAAALPSTVTNGTQHALPSAKEHLAHRNSRSARKPNLLCDKGLARVTPTAKPPAEIADKSKPKVSKARSITHQKSLDVTATPSSTQKSQAGVRLSVNTPKSIMKDTKSAKIVKPIFTVGRNDASVKKEGLKHDGSGIPRFVSFARRLKVPNFARIHERAFNRMEALDDYVDKKRKRTDTIGSATKKPE